MIKVNDIITKESIHPNCRYSDELLNDIQYKRTDFEEKLNSYTQDIKELLGEKYFNEAEWVKILKELVYLNTRLIPESCAHSLYENVLDSVFFIFESADSELSTYKNCIDKIGFKKAAIIGSVDFYRSNPDAIADIRTNLNLVYLISNLYYNEMWQYTNWNNVENVKGFINLNSDKYPDISNIKSTPLLQELLLVFDTSKSLISLLDALGGNANYFIRAIGGLEGEIQGDLNNLLAVLNDILKGICLPTDAIIKGVIFDNKDGISHEIIEGILADTSDDIEYYEAFRKYFKYASKEYELRKNTIKGFC